VTPLPAPAPLQPGDIVWAFAEEPPFHDQRVSVALAILMKQQIDLATRGTSARVVPANADLRRITGADQVPLLLRAAGFGQTPPFIPIAPCRVWVAPPPAEAHLSMQLDQAATIVADALNQALDGLGVRTEACAPTARIEEGHLFIWMWVSDASHPLYPKRQQPTFLSWRDFPPRPSAPRTGGAGSAASAALPLLLQFAGLALALGAARTLRLRISQGVSVIPGTSGGSISIVVAGAPPEQEA
jgi:hypothetical protein